MGVSLAVWRIRIGLYHGAVKDVKMNSLVIKFKSNKCFYVYGIIIIAVLVIGGVEQNPGPTSSQKSDIAEIKEMFKALQNTNDSVLCEVRELKDTVAKLVNRIDNIESKCEQMKSDVNELQDYTRYLEDRVDDLENRSRRQNIVVYGMKESVNETWTETESKVRDLIQDRLKIEMQEMDLQRCHRVGRQYDGKPRPIVCKFLADKKKKMMLKDH